MKKDGEGLAPEAQREGFKTLSDSAKSAAFVDVTHHQSNTEAHKNHTDVLKEAVSKADTPEERLQYAKMSQDSFDSHQERADRTSERSHETQRGAMTIVGKVLWGIAGTAAVGGIVAGANWLIGKVKGQ